MRTLLKVLVALTLAACVIEAGAETRMHRRTFLLPITSPSLTAVARDGTRASEFTTTPALIAGSREYAPQLIGTILRMYAEAPDFATAATTYTISVINLSTGLLTTTTAVLQTEQDFYDLL